MSVGVRYQPPEMLDRETTTEDSCTPKVTTVVQPLEVPNYSRIVAMSKSRHFKQALKNPNPRNLKAIINDANCKTLWSYLAGYMRLCVAQDQDEQKVRIDTGIRQQAIEESKICEEVVDYSNQAESRTNQLSQSLA
jgi:hypothetical protein